MTIIDQLKKTIKNIFHKKGFNEFKKDLGQRESGNDYKCKNSEEFLGRWQFGMARLSDYGITYLSDGKWKWKNGYSEENFLNSPELQDRVFKWHVANIVKSVKTRYSAIIGTKVDGVYIDVSGLVAGVHLGGIGGVNTFLFAGVNYKDSLGTGVKDYIQQFSGYNL